MRKNSALELDHIAAVRLGSRQSFRWLYEQYFDHIYRFCASLIAVEADAEEVSADVFVTVWRRRESLHSHVSLRPLLYKIARDLAWNHLRKTASNKQRREAFVLSVERSRVIVGEAQIFQNEPYALLETAIKSLTPRQERVFRMRFLSGHTLGDIAHELHISKNTVKVHLAKSKQCVMSIFQSRIME